MEYKFIFFPISLMNGFFDKKEETINRILDYGIFNLCLKINANLNDVATQLMYGYYRKRNDLSHELAEIMDKYVDEGKLLIDEDYEGFAGNEFQPDYELDTLIPLLEKDEKFRYLAVEYTVSKHVMSRAGIGGFYENVLENGKKISEEINPKEPSVSVDFKKLFEYRDTEKTEQQMIQLAAFIAVKSILGKKPYCRTTKAMILSRMFGYPKIQESINHVLFTKYQKRYHFTKLMESLNESWGILNYSHYMRGMYIGYVKKISLEKLIEIAETKKNKSKIMQEKKRKIREQVLKKF